MRALLTSGRIARRDTAPVVADPNPLLDRRRIEKFFALPLAACIAVVIVTASATATQYRLSIQDRIEIKVVEWQSETSTPIVWEAVSSLYLVDDIGHIAVPLIGSVAAAGLTTDQLAERLADLFQEMIGLRERPGVAVTVAEFQPIFVLGEVKTAGSYPFAPGLTPLRALALAGGEEAAFPLALATLSDTVRVLGDMGDGKIQLARLRAREARLEAEVADREHMVFPKRLDHPHGPEAEAQVKADELAIFQTRQSGLRRTLEALDDLKRLFMTEVDALTTKLSGQKAQSAIVQEALANLEGLATRGLVTSDRVMTLQRTLIDLSSSEIDLETATFRARAEIGKIDREVLDAKGDRAAEAAALLATVRSDIERLKVAISTGASVVGISEARFAELIDEERRTELHFMVLRHRDGTTTEIEGTADTALEPGDVLTVTRVPAASASPDAIRVGLEQPPPWSAATIQELGSVASGKAGATEQR